MLRPQAELPRIGGRKGVSQDLFLRHEEESKLQRSEVLTELLKSSKCEFLFVIGVKQSEAMKEVDAGRVGNPQRTMLGQQSEPFAT